MKYRKYPIILNSKVTKLAEQFNDLLEEDFCKPINENFCKIYKKDEIISELKNANAIIDISTSIAVARLLARDYDNQISTRRISAFLNPTGQDLVILAEDAKRKSRLSDINGNCWRQRLQFKYFRLGLLLIIQSFHSFSNKSCLLSVGEKE